MFGASLRKPVPVGLEAAQPVPYAPHSIVEGDGMGPALPQLKQRGMFAGATINPGNAIAGFLAGMYPQYANAFLAPMMERQRQQAQDAQYQRERADKRDDFTFEQDYRAAHPVNDTANDYAFWQQHLSPQDFETWKRNKIDPPQYMNVPGVGLVQIPKSAPAAPTAPVGKLTPIGAGGPTSGSGGFQY